MHPGLLLGNKLIKRINGPVGFLCCTPKQPLKLQNVNLPVFVLLGDQHFSISNGCSNTNDCVSVVDGTLFAEFDTLATSLNIKIDLVTEHYLDPTDLRLYSEMSRDTFAAEEQKQCKQAPIEKPGIINSLIKCNLGCFTANQACKTTSNFRWTFGDPRYTRHHVFRNGGNYSEQYLEGLVHTLVDIMKPVSFLPRMKASMSYRDRLNLMNEQSRDWVRKFKLFVSKHPTKIKSAPELLTTIERLLVSVLHQDVRGMCELLFSSEVYKHSMCMQAINKQIQSVKSSEVDVVDWWIEHWPVWVYNYLQYISKEAQMKHFKSRSNQAIQYIQNFCQKIRKCLENEQLIESTIFFDKILHEDVFFRIVCMLTVCMDIYILAKYLTVVVDPPSAVVCYVGLTHCENIAYFLTDILQSYTLTTNINNIPYANNQRSATKSEHRCIEFTEHIDFTSILKQNQV
jgi:hypothetical protein